MKRKTFFFYTNEGIRILITSSYMCNFDCECYFPLLGKNKQTSKLNSLNGSKQTVWVTCHLSIIRKVPQMLYLLSIMSNGLVYRLYPRLTGVSHNIRNENRFGIRFFKPTLYGIIGSNRRRNGTSVLTNCYQKKTTHLFTMPAISYTKFALCSRYTNQASRYTYEKESIKYYGFNISTKFHLRIS